MKKLLLFVLAAFAFVACTQNDVEELTANRQGLLETITVGFEGDDTRIELNEVCKTVWSAGDEASVFYHSNANQRWAFQGETGDRIGTLKRVANAEATAQMTNVVVVYPYNTNYWLNYANGNIEATLPAVQSYKEGSYGADGNIMVAQSEFTQFSLKSVCGWLRVELTGKRHIVNSITLRGNAGEQVAGLIYVDTATAEAILASEMGEASDEEEVGGVGGGLEFDDTIFREVTLDCGDGVELGAEATAFYIALLPQTFEKGMTIDIDYANAEPQTLVCDNSITIRRNHIAPMNSEVKSVANPPATELWYTATALVEPNSSAFNVAIVSNEWDEAMGEGVITFDGELTTIGANAFSWCGSLTSVTIGDSVTTIGDYAFHVCSSLTSVYCKAAAPPHIENAVFNGNSTDRKIYVYEECVDAYKTAWSEYADSIVAGGNIPESVTTTILYTTSDGAVIDTSKFPVKSHTYNNGVGELILYGELKAIPDRAFYEFDTLTTITIPDSVTTIGDYAFYLCDNLTSVTIGDSVTTIGDSAFRDCRSLTSVTIPDSVTTIGTLAFAYCDDLTSVTIGDSVTTIGDDAFMLCTSLTSVTIPDSVTTIGVQAFYGCDSLTSVTIGDSVTTIGDSAFYYCESLTSVTIPDSVTSIGYGTFVHCRSLTSVTIGNSVTTIGNLAFAGCSNLAEFKGKFAADGGRCLIKDNAIIAYAEASGTTYTIPDYVTTIGEEAFSNCNSLTSVTIPDSVTTIGEEAFYWCSSLTSVTIPDSVTTIGNSAFRSCNSLTSVYCKATTPPSLGYDAFKYWDGSAQEDVNIGCAIYVPAESVEEYKAATNWSEYAADILAYDFETGEVVDTTPANEL